MPLYAPPSAASSSTLGVVGKVSNASSTQSVTTEADLTNMTVTITAVAGRVYKVSAKVSCTFPASDAQLQVRIYADGSAVDGTVGSAGIMYSSGTRYCTLTPVAYVTGLSAGSRVIKLTAIATGATATIKYDTATAYLIVEDIGAA